MYVHDRIYGIETEFGTMIRTPDGEFESTDYVTKAEYFARIKKCPSAIFTEHEQGRSWHVNGSLVYVDFNEHPEHATAECRRVRDVIAGYKAGELIVSEIFSGRMGQSASNIILFKNNLARSRKGDTTTFGCHDNYSLTQRVNSPIFQERIIPFLVTRQILDGAGTWDNERNFILSQRACMIEAVRGAIATNMRPIIQSKPTQDTGERLHLVLGDSNIMEAAAFLKVGTTAVVLALIDAGLVPEIAYEEPVQSLHDIAKSADPHARVFRVFRMEYLSALEVQYMYLEAAKRHLVYADYQSEDTREEFMDIIALWSDALQAIRDRNYEWMLGRLDYATKRYLFEKQIARGGLSGEQIDETRRNIDILYHDISNRSLQELMNKRWASRRILSDEEIMHAKIVSPKGTRAELRAKFVERALAAGEGNKCKIAWNYITFARIGEPECFYLLDPFETATNRLDLFLSKVGL